MTVLVIHLILDPYFERVGDGDLTLVCPLICHLHGKIVLSVWSSSSKGISTVASYVRPHDRGLHSMFSPACLSNCRSLGTVSAFSRPVASLIPHVLPGGLMSVGLIYSR